MLSPTSWRTSPAVTHAEFSKARALVIAAIWGIHDDSGRPGLFDSVIQSAWSCNLALRSRGLGSTWTTLLNASVDELAGILGIPDGITTIVTFPVAYTKGTEFKPAVRRRAEQITYFDRWGFTKSRVSTDGGTAFDDGLAVVAEVDIDASPRRVWPSNTDITRPVGARRSSQVPSGTAMSAPSGRRSSAATNWASESGRSRIPSPTTSRDGSLSGAPSIRCAREVDGASRSWTRASEAACGSRWRSIPRTT